VIIPKQKKFATKNIVFFVDVKIEATTQNCYTKNGFFNITQLIQKVKINLKEYNPFIQSSFIDFFQLIFTIYILEKKQC